MKNTFKKIFTPLAVFVLFFVGAWTTIDLSEIAVFKGLDAVQAVSIDCTSCINHDGGGGGGGWLDFGGGGGGWGGGGEIGGGGGGGYVPPAPVCTLDLTKNKITWTTTNATTVNIVPLTNSPAVPGASGSSGPTPGTVLVNMDFGQLKAQYSAKLQQDVGSYVMDGFYANKATADRICQVIAPGTVNGAYQWDDYSSPGNNTVLIWNGSAWNQYGAKNYNRHFRYNFTCVVPSTGTSPYALSGSTDFVPPLGVGTHTYRLTATGPGGTRTCEDTVVVPPPPTPPPVCELWAQPSSVESGGDVRLKWTSSNATKGTINQGVGNIHSSKVADGHKLINPTQTKTYTATFEGPGGTVTCSTKVTVTPPPAPGCIQILKETFDTNGNVLTPVAQFTFKLDGDRTVRNDANGNARFDNVEPGWHTVTEVNPGSAWDMFSVTPLNGRIYVPNSSTCVAMVFKNKQVVTTPEAPTCTLDLTARKITWTTTNASKVTIVPTTQSPSVGTNLPLNGSHDFDPPLGPGDHFYRMEVTGTNGEKVWCGEALYIPPVPPAPGCIEVLKETYNPNGVQLTPVAQFTFKLDGDRTVRNDANGNARFDNVEPGWHTVTEVNPGSAWDMFSVTPLNGRVEVKSGSTCSAVVFKNKQIVTSSNPPACTLSANPTSVYSGDTSTLSWTTHNAVSFEIDQGIGSVTPVSGGSTTTPALTSTKTFVGTARSASGQTVTCTADVGVLPPPGPFCTLSVSKSEINPGESISISWTSGNVTSGFINNNVGTTTPVASGTINNVFPSTDTLYTGTFKGPYGDVTCTAEVRIKKTGCVGNCGGGLEQPRVSLASAPPGQVLGASFVSLSQIPYTGFEAGTTLTLVFWGVVALWSIGITYIFMGKGGIQFLAGRALAFATPTPVARREEDEEVASYTAPVPEVKEEMYTEPVKETFVEPAQHVYQSTITAPVRMQPVATQSAAPVQAQPVFEPKQAATDGLPAVSDVIESRAHAAGVLLSPEAVAIAVGLSTDRAQTLQRFGELLNEAVRTIPREDGWILLSAERMRTLVKESADDIVQSVVMTAPTQTAPVAEKKVTAPVVDASAADRFVATLLSGDRDGAFTILNALEHEASSPSRFATSVATLLDKLYRSRKTGAQFDDVQLKEKAALISDEGLQQLVEVFVHALDTAYASKYTGLKIAVAQAFDIRSN